MFNIMQNAVKFNVHGGRIVVTQDYDEENKLLRTTVRDTGQGISEERQKTLFMIFRHQIVDRVENNNYDVSSGVGIGLTNSKILAESLGGTISVKSEKDRFTEVTFTMKATEVVPDRAPSVKLSSGMVAAGIEAENPVARKAEVSKVVVHNTTPFYVTESGQCEEETTVEEEEGNFCVA